MSGFLWGASSAPHQVEGNNINSDWWAREGAMPGMEPSGDACDSYHRYREDMRLLADAGLNAYRFGVEWARIETRPGEFSRAELAHYRRMIDAAVEFGLTPVVTLHHFSSPRWFAEEGGWLSDRAVDQFVAYVAEASTILDGVEWVATINEPNMLAMMITMQELARAGQVDTWQSPTVETVEGSEDRARPAVALPIPDIQHGRRLVAAHQGARSMLQERIGARVGWTVANQALTALPGGEETLVDIRHAWEDLYLDAAVGDDFIGVQSYSSQSVDADGLVPHLPHPDNTMVGTAYRPDALGMAVRHAWERTGGVPILVTENGIATPDDTRRIAYTSEALDGLEAAVADGVDVRGYLHWSLLDNYEWGHWEPTFGLVAVDRATFERTPKPSLHWLGRAAAERSPRIASAARAEQDAS